MHSTSVSNIYPRLEGPPQIGHPTQTKRPVDLLIKSIPPLAISLLLNLEVAQIGRSVMFSDEQKLLFKGWKKGFVMNTKLDFKRH
jgi:hypothetical protein